MTALVFLAALTGTDTAIVVATVVTARGFLEAGDFVLVALLDLEAGFEVLLFLEAALDVFLAME